MHYLGYAGMPRRVPDYPDCFYYFNQIATIGSYISTFAIIIFFYLIYKFLAKGSIVNEKSP